MSERCPRCGAYVEEGDEIDHVVDGDCERIRLNGEIEDLRRQLAQAQEELQQALAREAELRRVVEAAIAARDAFRLYDNPEKWHKAIAKLARVVEDLDPKLVVALDREEGRGCDS